MEEPTQTNAPVEEKKNMGFSYGLKKRYKDKSVRTVYTRTLITKSILLPITAIGQNLKQTIEETIKSLVEGKCIVEGFVKQNSIEIITYSSGEIKGDKVLFEAAFYCDVCFPVAGMLLNCIAKNITKAGIRGESADEAFSPFIVFIARDHYFASEYFNSIEEGGKFTARVLAQRFELNDKYVSVIAEIVPPKKQYTSFGQGQGQGRQTIKLEEVE